MRRRAVDGAVALNRSRFVGLKEAGDRRTSPLPLRISVPRHTVLLPISTAAK